MAFKCTVGALRKLARYNVVTQVINSLSHDEGRNCEVLSQYFEYVPAEILEDILTQILGRYSIAAGIRFLCLKVFLKNRVRNLTPGFFPDIYYERILNVIATNGTGLTHLNLEGIWASEYPELLCNIIKNLVRLEVLNIPSMADDMVLEGIANSSSLRVVNISSECPFTLAGLTTFSKMLATNKTNITVIDIGNYGVQEIPYESIAELIEMNPQLINLHTYTNVGKALRHIQERNQTFQCAMQYIHDKDTTQDILQAILQTCPKIDNLYLENPQQGVIDKLSHFKTLTTLKLFKFQCSEIHSLLGLFRDNNLLSLDLNLGIGVLDMSTIARYCTKVTSLKLIQMQSVMHSTEEIFASLHDIQIMLTQVTTPCLTYMLGRSPELVKIEILDPIYMTDGDIRKICNGCSLWCLEEIFIAEAKHLTVNAVKLLIALCPRLHVLGMVGQWNLSSNDVEHVRHLLRGKNTKIHLIIDWMNYL